jgi:hypothetical protein
VIYDDFEAEKNKKWVTGITACGIYSVPAEAKGY